jgi:hypothetical protein
MRRSGILIGLFTLVLINLAWADVPRPISYQGVLRDNAGDVLNGSYDLRFTLFDDTLFVSMGWVETHSGVTVTDGIFNVILGSITSFSSASIFFSEPYELQIEVSPAGQAQWQTLDPRADLTTVPYAHKSRGVQTATMSFRGGGGGRLGIGNPSPTRGLEVTRSMPGDYLASIENTDAASGGEGLLVGVTDTVTADKSAFTVQGNGEPFFTVTNKGRVGVGIDYPGFKFHVYETKASNSYIAYINHSPSTTGSAWGLKTYTVAPNNTSWWAYGGDIYARGGNTGGGARGLNISAYGYGSNTTEGVRAYSGGSGTGTRHAVYATATGSTGPLWAFYGQNGNIYGADSLALGTTNFSGARMNVVGGIQADSVTADKIKIPTTSRYYSLPHADFEAANDAYNYLRSTATPGYLMMNSGFGYFWAPIHLPDGSTIEELRIHYYDSNDTLDVQAVLYRMSFSTGSLTSHGSAVSSTVGYGNTSTSPSLTIDNATYAYMVRLYLPTYGTDLRFIGTRIRYAITSVMP